MPVFNTPGGASTPSGALAPSFQQLGQRIQQTIEQRRADRREALQFLTVLSPEQANATIAAIGAEGLQAFGLTREEATRAANTVAGGGNFREPTTAEQQQQQLGGLQVQQAQTNLQQSRADLGGTRLQQGTAVAALGEALIRRDTGQTVDPALRDESIRRMQAGQPLPEMVAFTPEFSQRARLAGFADDTQAFGDILRRGTVAGVEGAEAGVESTRAQTSLTTVQEDATVAQTEATLAGTQQNRANAIIAVQQVARIADGTAGGRQLTGLEAAQLIDDPGNAPFLGQLVVPEALERQVGSWARVYFGGDEDKTRAVMAQLAVHLPRQQAASAILQSDANAFYLMALEERVLAEALAAASGAGGGSGAPTAASRTTASKEIATALQKVLKEFRGGKLRSITSEEIDPQTGEIVLGKSWFTLGLGTPRPVRDTQSFLGTDLANFTVADIIELAAPPPGTDPTDEAAIDAAIEAFVARKHPNARNISQLNVVLETFDDAGNKVPVPLDLPKLKNLIASARTEVRKAQQIALANGIDLTPFGFGAATTGARGPAAAEQQRPQPTGRGASGATLRQQQGAVGGVLDETLERVFPERMEALRRLAAGERAAATGPGTGDLGGAGDVLAPRPQQQQP